MPEPAERPLSPGREPLVVAERVNRRVRNEIVLKTGSRVVVAALALGLSFFTSACSEQPRVEAPARVVVAATPVPTLEQELTQNVSPEEKEGKLADVFVKDLGRVVNEFAKPVLFSDERFEREKGEIRKKALEQAKKLKGDNDKNDLTPWIFLLGPQAKDLDFNVLLRYSKRYGEALLTTRISINLNNNIAGKKTISKEFKGFFEDKYLGIMYRTDFREEKLTEVAGILFNLPPNLVWKILKTEYPNPYDSFSIATASTQLDGRRLVIHVSTKGAEIGLEITEPLKIQN